VKRRMFLEKLPQRKNRKTDDKRLGRGYGSGVGGHTVGRGQKGQKSRSGHKSTLFLEGGFAFYRRVPKYRGFKNNAKIVYQPVNLNVLEVNFNDGDVVSVEALKEKSLIRKRTEHVKILGIGEISKKLTLKDVLVSEKAKEKLLTSGGSIE
jgi:large subunit ribosomal protein L15